MKIPITKPNFTQEDEASILDALRSGWVTQGPKVQAFEEAFANKVGARYAVATSSCTTALHLALIAAGVSAGDEVICPSFTFIATANAILYCGARPIFIDIDPETYNLDPSLLQRAVTSRTKAILVVHQVGLPADMDRINSIAAKHGISVIEDAACAIGATYKQEPIGKPHSFLACFSFHPRKILTTGEGGMITTNDEDVAVRLKQLRHHGMSVSDLARHQSKTVVSEEYRELGYNYRMSDLHAALGLSQLQRLDEIIKKRRVLAETYRKAFSEISYLRPPIVPEYAAHTFQSYILRLLPEAPISRDELMTQLLKRGIASRRGIMAIHKEPFYAKEYTDLSLSATESAIRDTLIIPLYSEMKPEEQNYVISNILELVAQPAR